MRCMSCGGPAHPATGCQYSETAITCYRCTVDFWKWVRDHTNKKARRKRRVGGVDTAMTFYEAAGLWKH